MKPDEFRKLAVRLYGHRAWQRRIADDLGVDESVISRLLKREQIKPPFDVAINAMVNQKVLHDFTAREARKLMGRHARLKKRKLAKSKLIPYAGKEPE